MSDATKTVTLRLPDSLYTRSSRLAHRKKLSFNAYVQESLDTALRLEEDQALYEAFGRFGADKSATDVGYAEGAQKESLLHHESPKAR